MTSVKAEIEERLEEFVKSKTAEKVYLDISKPKTITIKHKSKRGSIALATFWVNVLQCPNNYPVQKFPFRKIYDKNGGYKVILRVDDVTITVFMTNGTLMIQGEFALDWFKKRFTQIMLAFDSQPQEPQPISDGYMEHEKNWNCYQKDQQTKKDFQLLKDQEEENASLEIADLHNWAHSSEKDENNETEKKKDNSDCKQEEKEDIDDLSDELELMSLDKDKWTEDVLEKQLESLSTSAVRSGPSYIYPLWKSLLYLWLSNADNRVYIATPFLDTERMTDVCRLVLEHRLTSNIDAFFTRLACDHAKKISDVKETAQRKFDPAEQVIIEYRLYNRIVYPLNRFHCKFIACINSLGKAQVLVTSANFHGDHFVAKNLESVVYQSMTESKFTARFLKPLTESVTIRYD